MRRGEQARPHTRSFVQVLRKLLCAGADDHATRSQRPDYVARLSKDASNRLHISRPDAVSTRHPSWVPGEQQPLDAEAECMPASLASTHSQTPQLLPVYVPHPCPHTGTHASAALSSPPGDSSIHYPNSSTSIASSSDAERVAQRYGFQIAPWLKKLPPVALTCHDTDDDSTPKFKQQSGFTVAVTAGSSLTTISQRDSPSHDSSELFPACRAQSGGGDSPRISLQPGLLSTKLRLSRSTSVNGIVCPTNGTHRGPGSSGGLRTGTDQGWRMSRGRRSCRQAQPTAQVFLHPARPKQEFYPRERHHRDLPQAQAPARMLVTTIDEDRSLRDHSSRPTADTPDPLVTVSGGQEVFVADFDVEPWQTTTCTGAAAFQTSELNMGRLANVRIGAGNERRHYRHSSDAVLELGGACANPVYEGRRICVGSTVEMHAHDLIP